MHSFLYVIITVFSIISLYFCTNIMTILSNGRVIKRIFSRNIFFLVFFFLQFGLFSFLLFLFPFFMFFLFHDHPISLYFLIFSKMRKNENIVTIRLIVEQKAFFYLELTMENLNTQKDYTQLLLYLKSQHGEKGKKLKSQTLYVERNLISPSCITNDYSL